MCVCVCVCTRMRASNLSDESTVRISFKCFYTKL